MPLRPNLSLWAPACLTHQPLCHFLHTVTALQAPCVILPAAPHTHARFVVTQGQAKVWPGPGQRGAEAVRGSPRPLGIPQCPPSSHQEHSPAAIHGFRPLSRGPQLLLLHQPDSHLRLQQRLHLLLPVLRSLPGPGPSAQLLLPACGTCPDRTARVSRHLTEGLTPPSASSASTPS